MIAKRNRNVYIIDKSVEKVTILKVNEPRSLLDLRLRLVQLNEQSLKIDIRENI